MRRAVGRPIARATGLRERLWSPGEISSSDRVIIGARCTSPPRETANRGTSTEEQAMATMVMIAMTAWLWLGIVPQLVLGPRHRSTWHLLGEWLAGPIGLARGARPRRHTATPPPDRAAPHAPTSATGCLRSTHVDRRPPRPSTEARFADAVAVANIPTLLMVLVQLTGDTRWLHDPYRPVRPRGMGDNDSGGLPESVQQEIRDAALEAILAWRDGRPVAIPTPEPAMLVEMLAVAMGEAVPDEYGEMIGAQIGMLDRPQPEPVVVPDGFSVVIVGAGVAGICAAIHLQRAGIPFTVFEKSTTVGGTWWDNRYPGAGVDTPNHLYSFSFAPYDWSMYFALRDELHEYLEHVADEFDVRRHIRFETKVEAMAYDEADAALGRHGHPAGRFDRAGAAQRGHQRHGDLQPAEVPGHPRPRPLRRPEAAHRGLAGRPRPHRQARGRHRQRGQLHAARPGGPAPGRVADHLPALAALGRAVRALPHARARPDPDAAARRPAVPRLVPRPAGMDVQRPHLRAACTRTPTGSTRSAR